MSSGLRTPALWWPSVELAAAAKLHAERRRASIVQYRSQVRAGVPDPMMHPRCDILAVLREAQLARHGIGEHDVGTDPYVVNEPQAYGGRTLHFCSLAHLAWWVRVAAVGADKRTRH